MMKRSVRADEGRCKELSLPFSYKSLVSCSSQEYRCLLRSYSLNNEQLEFVKEIRKRNKNKVSIFLFV